MNVPRVDVRLACLACRVPLQVELDDDGFVMVSEGEWTASDPIVADHEKWRAGALISIITGTVLLIYLAASAVMDYDSHGMAFFRQTSNMVFLSLAVLFSLVAILGGALVFHIARRELGRYNDVVARRRGGPQ
jgi:hypothetical protein